MRAFISDPQQVFPLSKIVLEAEALGDLERRDDASPIGAGGFLLLPCLNRRSSNLSAAVTAGRKSVSGLTTWVANPP